MLVLSGDIGGTTTRLQFTDFADSGKVTIIKSSHYKNSNYASFSEIIDDFFVEANLDKDGIASACFGVAGPVVDGVVKFTNLPWVLKTDEIKNQLKIDKVKLLNDFVAIGYGLERLQPNDLLTLQPGKPCIDGVKAYIGAGTGLGVGFITYDKGITKVYPTEGGHVDFAPTDDEQLELLVFLRKKYHRVSFERVLSGAGLINIYSFIRASSSSQENPELKALINSDRSIDIAAAITEFAVKHQDPLATEALNIFIRIYGAAAGNLALTTLPFGGLYIVGGIAPKLLPLIKNGMFLEAFYDKGRMSDLLGSIPLHLVLDSDVALQGAALYAKN